MGMSDLIHSSAISTPEAIGAATRIKADMHSATVHDLNNVAHMWWKSNFTCILRRQISDITISDDEYRAPEEVSISNSGAKLPSFLNIFMCWLLEMFIFSRMHCVCKQKQIYFFPFGARITDVLVLCVLYFPQKQHTEELWLYIGTVSGGKDGRKFL